jgi:ribose-phosphate pyrophosphokinase
MQVVALPGGQACAQALAERLGCPWSPLAVHRFPDGEALVRLDAGVAGQAVVFAGSLHPPDDVTLPLLFAADAARELGAARVALVAPYLPYLRQDARFEPGEAVSSRSYARLLSASLDVLVTADAHLHRWNRLGEIYTLDAANVASAPAIAQWLARHVPRPLLVGPDSESAQWVAEVARLANAPWRVMDKTRRGDRDVEVRLTGEPPPAGYTPVLLDDIVSTGHTLAAAARALRGPGLPAPLCIAVHALFAPGAQGELERAGIAQVVTCDSVPHPTNAIALAPLLAPALLERLS